MTGLSPIAYANIQNIFGKAKSAISRFNISDGLRGRPALHLLEVDVLALALVENLLVTRGTARTLRPRCFPPGTIVGSLLIKGPAGLLEVAHSALHLAIDTPQLEENPPQPRDETEYKKEDKSGEQKK